MLRIKLVGRWDEAEGQLAEGTPNSRDWHDGRDVMTYLIEVPLDGADPIVMEVDEAGDGGIVRSARPGTIIGTAATSFDAALERLQPMAQALIVRLRDLAERPDGIDVEFGLRMSMDAGLVVAHTSGEAIQPRPADLGHRQRRQDRHPVGPDPP
jgi:hypothetical protein